MKIINKRKKTICLVMGITIAVIVCGLYFGISNQNKEKDELENKDTWQDVYVGGGMDSYPNNGILYIEETESGGHQMRFCDNESGQNTILCQDKTCSHMTGQDSTCGAKASRNIAGCAVRGKYLYFFAQEKDGEEMSFIRCDLDGTNRKNICTVEKEKFVTIVNVYYRKQYVVYSSIQSGLDDENKNVVEIGKIDLETCENEIIYRLEATNAWITAISTDGKVVAAQVGYNDATSEQLLQKRYDEKFASAHDHSEIIGIDFLSHKQIFTLDGITSGGLDIPMINQKLYYTDLQGNNCCYDIKSQGIEKISSRDLTVLSGNHQSYLYYQDYIESNANAPYQYYRYELKTGNMEELGSSNVCYNTVTDEIAYGIIEGQRCFISENDFLQGHMEDVTTYKRR